MTTKKERAEALARMTKAELVKTIHALDKKQTQLLNELAKAKGAPVEHLPENIVKAHITPAPPAFPWSTCEGS